MKKEFYFLITAITILLSSCASTSIEIEKEEEIIEEVQIIEEVEKEYSLTMLFAGDVMAHNVNYNMSDYDLIWEHVKDEVSSCDLSFANIEAPIDTTKAASNYPAFNMPKKYAQAVLDAGFNVFSLCNNHSNDKGLNGILETIKTTKDLTLSEEEKGNKVYFAGLRESKTDTYTYHLIEKDEWKILFLPMTEVLNTPTASGNVNYINTTKAQRDSFIEHCKKLREENPCDLFVLSLHAFETEYIRTVTKTQEEFYQKLLDAGVDIIWANHAHIIKDRKVKISSETGEAKIIMYANGNTISGQRTSPNLYSANPIGERDNTGDGLFYKVTFTKTSKDPTPKYKESKNMFITVYKPTSKDYVVEFLNEDFITYLNENNKKDWARYAEKRIKINNEYTKEIIEWQ